MVERTIPRANCAIRDAVLAGDVELWQTWYAANYDRLAEYVRWRCGGLVDLAEDAIQETWLTAVRKLGSFDPKRGSFFAWLCGIAANASRNAIRKRRRERRRSRPLVAGDEPTVMHRKTEASEKAERVALALAELPEQYESVLRAKYLERKTVAQIADDRGETCKGVESLLTRARQAFREIYEKSHE